MNLAQDTAKWQTLVSTTMKIQNSQYGKFLAYLRTTDFLKKDS
jgi:hypothetical protein